jgi:hypothetical protein
MLSDDQAVTLTRRFQAQLALIGRRYAATTTAQFQTLETYNEDDVPRYVDRIRPTTVAARRTAVAAGVGYYSMLTQVAPPAVRYDEVDIPDESREPFIATWTAQKHGAPLAVALAAGVSRAEAIARNLTLSSARRSGDLVMDRTGQRFAVWVRVPDGAACEWCRQQAAIEFSTATAADYGHDRCGCTPRPSP